MHIVTRLVYGAPLWNLELFVTPSPAAAQQAAARLAVFAHRLRNMCTIYEYKYIQCRNIYNAE